MSNSAKNGKKICIEKKPKIGDERFLSMKLIFIFLLFNYILSQMQFMFNLYIQNGNEHVQSIQHIESKKKVYFCIKKNIEKNIIGKRWVKVLIKGYLLVLFGLLLQYCFS